MKGVKPEDIAYRWGARGLMALMLAVLLLLVYLAWHRKARNNEC
jgi:hypothetical protein